MKHKVLEQMLVLEEELQFKYFNNHTAWEIGCAIKKVAEKNGLSVVIEIFCFGQILFSYAMSKTSIEHQNWVRRKRQAVLCYGQSSYYLGQYNAFRQRKFEEQAHIDANEYCAHGGSFPIRIKHCGLVGAVTVSGLPQIDDHNLVIGVLRGYLK